MGRLGWGGGVGRFERGEGFFVVKKGEQRWEKGYV